MVGAGRFWSGTDDIGRFISQVGNTAEATQPQLHPGVGAGQWLPSPPAQWGPGLEGSFSFHGNS